MTSSAEEAPARGQDAPAEAAPAIRVRAQPNMPKDALETFKKRLYRARCYLEYGAGGSTRLAARMAVPAIFSVESDAAKAAAVTVAVHAEGSGFLYTMVTPAIGPTDRYGRPTGTEQIGDWPEYSLAVWRNIARRGLSPDLVLIQGPFRVATFMATLLHAEPGTTILFENYVGRERHYPAVAKILKPTGGADRLGIFAVPADLPLREIATELARHSVRP